MTLRSDPDGIEVVRAAADAAALPVPPLLVIDGVLDHLDEIGLGSGPLAWQRIGEGYSNVTYLLERGGDRFVLRRGPRPPIPRSTHDMLREARFQSALGDRGFPVPRILSVSEDERVLGVPFYLMEYLDGLVVTDALPDALEPLAHRRSASVLTVDTLSALHAIDATEGDLAAFGRPDGYLARQVERFTGLWPESTTRSIPVVGRVAEWLGRNLPASQRAAVVHGDFRMGNLMFSPEVDRVHPVLDWEMATIGDPLADLGYLTATYADPDIPATVMELTGVTRRPGFLHRAELVPRYAARSDLDLTALPWYQVLALWKSAIFCEAIYTRWLRGESPDDTRFAPQLEAGVPDLLDAAARIAAIG